jgi:5'-nucleotidase
MNVIHERPLILVCNDDGVASPGISALAQSLTAVADVAVVAPDRERSAASHSLTLNRPLRVLPIKPNWFSVDGTPTDCVTLAVVELLQRRPALVASGINHGANLGDDITYSGTVSCAIEATLQGIPAFAISLAGEREYDFRAAAGFARRIAAEMLRRPLPGKTLLNVNVPNLPPEAIRGVTVTRQGQRKYSESVVKNVDPRGRTYYWIGGTTPVWERAEGTDYEAVQNGWISVTPLELDLTNHAALEALRSWRLSHNGDGARA